MSRHALSADDILSIEAAIGYTFCDKALLSEAMTHSSYLNEIVDKTRRSNERLEFLGDKVIGLIAGEYFYHTTNLSEGGLTELVKTVVAREPLSVVCDRLDIVSYLICGGSVNRKRLSVKNKSDIVEAIAGAIYLDGGYAAAREFFLTVSKLTV